MNSAEVFGRAALNCLRRTLLASSLEKRFGRKVRVHAEVDASLIGGATVRAGDLVIDGSLKSRLERLSVELTA